MTTFQIQIAGHVAKIHALFPSTKDYCRRYLSERPPELTVTVTEEDLRAQQAALDREAGEEGFRPRVFTDPFLERTAIQMAIADHLLRHGVLLFHGSAIAVDGMGYLFTAKSGTGKSTHTRLWRELFGPRAVMINDDKPFLRFGEDRIWLCGAPWSGKHGLDTNITVPLAGLCILTRGQEDTIRRISPADALPMLQKQAHCPPDPERQALSQALTERLSRQAPLWHMTCTPTTTAAATAHGAMWPTVRTNH